MKKIVGIIAAAALASAAFAVDFGGTVKLYTDIVSFKKTDGTDTDVFKVLNFSQNTRTNEDDSLIGFSTGDDLAGASVKFGINNGDVVGGWNTIWFKPIESLTITAGRPWIALSDTVERFNDQVTWRNDLNTWSMGAHETANWSNATALESATSQDSNSVGYAVEFNADALYIGAFMGAPYGYAWYDNDKIGVTGAVVKYNADFGSIQGMFAYNGQYGNPVYTSKTESTDAIRAGVGFYSAFSDTLKLNVNGGLRYVKDGKDLNYQAADADIYAAAYLGLTFDALEFDFGANLDMPTEDVDKNISSVVEAEVAYRLENAKLALFVMTGNALAKVNDSDNDMAFQIVPYVEGMFGAMNYNVGVQFNVSTDSDAFSFAIPAVLRVWF